MTLSDISFKDPLVQKVVGGLVVLILIVTVWYLQLYSPNRELINKKRQDLEQLNLTLQTARLQAGRLEEIEAELEEAFVKYKLLEKLLPTERNVPDFINKVNMAARQNNVNIARMDLDPSEIMEFYTADPYRMEVVGGYHDFGNFLQEIANLSFIATTKNIQLDKVAGDKVKATFIITSYHLPTRDRLEAPTEMPANTESERPPEAEALLEARQG